MCDDPDVLLAGRVQAADAAKDSNGVADATNTGEPTSNSPLFSGTSSCFAEETKKAVGYDFPGNAFVSSVPLVVNYGNAHRPSPERSTRETRVKKSTGSSVKSVRCRIASLSTSPESGGVSKKKHLCARRGNGFEGCSLFPGPTDTAFPTHAAVPPSCSPRSKATNLRPKAATLDSIDSRGGVRQQPLAGTAFANDVSDTEEPWVPRPMDAVNGNNDSCNVVMDLKNCHASQQTPTPLLKSTNMYAIESPIKFYGRVLREKKRMKKNIASSGAPDCKLKTKSFCADAECLLEPHKRRREVEQSATSMMTTTITAATTTTTTAAAMVEEDKEDGDENVPSRKRRVLTTPHLPDFVTAAPAPPSSCAMDFASLLNLLDGIPGSLNTTSDEAAGAVGGFVSDNIVVSAGSCQRQVQAGFHQTYAQAGEEYLFDIEYIFSLLSPELT